MLSSSPAALKWACGYYGASVCKRLVGLQSEKGF
jgi:hypothetical protein